jgi:hypothetical protein
LLVKQERSDQLGYHRTMEIESSYARKLGTLYIVAVKADRDIAKGPRR